MGYIPNASYGGRDIQVHPTVTITGKGTGATAICTIAHELTSNALQVEGI